MRSSSSIRSELIRKQEPFLDLACDEASTTDEMRALKREIDEKITRLKDRKIW